MGKGFDIGGLFRQAQELQERLGAVQEDLGTRTVEGSAGGGMVSVTVTGRLEIVSVRIDPALLENPDVEMLQDLVVAAVNAGIRAAQQMVQDEMRRLTGGLKLPGLG